MRLIDADKCPCIVCEETRNAHCTYEHRSCNRFCEWISRESYDVDKIIKELELHSFELGTDTLPVHYVRLNEAIKIVKQGGKKIKVVE